MRKIIIFVVLLSSTLFAQDTLATRIYTDVKSALAQMGQALSVGAEHVYEVLVRQQVINSITNLIIYSLVIIPICGIKYFYKRASEDKIQHIMACIISCAVTFGLTLYFFKTVNDTITGFFNPEYGAIKQIAEMIRK